MGRKENADRLAKLVDELDFVVSRLKQAEGTPEAGDSSFMFNATATADHFRELYRERRIRDEIFKDPELFGEPAWDILLDISSAAEHERRLSVTAVCIGSCVPPTTALRWIAVLEERGLIERSADPMDARRSYLSLTPAGRAKMRSLSKRLPRLRGSHRSHAPTLNSMRKSS